MTFIFPSPFNRERPSNLTWTANVQIVTQYSPWKSGSRLSRCLWISPPKEARQRVKQFSGRFCFGGSAFPLSLLPRVGFYIWCIHTYTASLTRISVLNRFKGNICPLWNCIFHTEHNDSLKSYFEEPMYSYNLYNDRQWKRGVWWKTKGTVHRRRERRLTFNRFENVLPAFIFFVIENTS